MTVEKLIELLKTFAPYHTVHVTIRRETDEGETEIHGFVTGAHFEDYIAVIDVQERTE